MSLVSSFFWDTAYSAIYYACIVS